MPAGAQLRPLGVGERLDASFKIFGRNFLPMAKAVLVLAVPAGIVDALITVSTALPKNAVTTGPLGTTTTNVPAGDFFSYGAGVLVILVISELVAAVATAACYRIIASSYLGQPVEWRQALRSGASRLLSIIWIGVLVVVTVIAPAAAIAIIAVVFGAANVHSLAVLVAVLGGIAWVVFVVWFAVCSSLAVPTLMIEGVRGQRAITRSIGLCRRKWWSVLGTEILAGLIVGIFSVVIDVVTGVVDVASHDNATAGAVAAFFTRTASLVFATPFMAAVLVIIAIDLRVRKEGFDLEVLASHLGLRPSGSALSFLRPPPPAGPWDARPGGWPNQPPSPAGYPPPVPPFEPASASGYPPPVPPFEPASASGYPPPVPPFEPASPDPPPVPPDPPTAAPDEPR